LSEVDVEDFTSIRDNFAPATCVDRNSEECAATTASLAAAIKNLQQELQIHGRERRGKLLTFLRHLLMAAAAGNANMHDTIVRCTPRTWRAFEARFPSQLPSLGTAIHRHKIQYEKGRGVLGTLEVATTDPLPVLLASLIKYEDEAYLGRGLLTDQVTPCQLWTTRIWSEVSAHVPSDGLPLFIKVYSDAFRASGASHHVFVLELGHFDSRARNTLDLAVTATLYTEPSEATRSSKIRIVNFAADLTMAWFHCRAVSGVRCRVAGRDVLLYPRLLVYDADQPEAVSLIGKTCYACLAKRSEFGETDLSCSVEPNTPLNTRMLRTFQLLATQGAKGQVASHGMRNPCEPYRLWSPTHHPFIDQRVGGIPRYVRVDDLHVTLLGTAKKFVQDLQELLKLLYGGGRDAVLRIFEEALDEIVLPRSVDKLVHYSRFVKPLWLTESLGGDELSSFTIQAPEAIVRFFQHQHHASCDARKAMARVLEAAVVARHVMLMLRVKRKFYPADIDELGAKTMQLRVLLQAAFRPVRSRWHFPKNHTMTAFAVQVCTACVHASSCMLLALSHGTLKFQMCGMA
jgi:hypothetical protein